MFTPVLGVLFSVSCIFSSFLFLNLRYLSTRQIATMFFARWHKNDQNVRRSPRNLRMARRRRKTQRRLNGQHRPVSNKPAGLPFKLQGYAHQTLALPKINSRGC
ncbi:hypothetical protein B0T22DRAFT_293797 [Podospora appendiculata]|uniref:Uncharacterized protein n=1 Tax=Podospora appendiculata TaxID=314037 RepID=A0AAE0X1J4_9PEZI|nr:hypothetical protein B0T22DRAFT_293797 [Podospora appendiculata]